MGLFSKNTHGTKKSTVAAVVQVDLRVAPNPARNQNISTDTNHSPIYKKVAFSNNYYFIPDGSNVCRVHWNSGSGKLGESIRYEVYVSYNNGGWQKLADIASNGADYLHYNHIIPKQTVSQQFKYLIRTITSYGYHSDAITPAQTLHFYNTPGISVGTMTRGATTCDVKVTVKTNTSIPNVSTVGSWLTNPATSRGNLNASQGEQNIAVTGLTDAGTYTLKVTYNDNTGFSSNQVRDIAIGQNTPIFFINKYGIGVNGAQANSTIALNVKGAANVSNILNSNLLGGSGANGSTKVSDLNNIWKSGFYDVEGAANQPFGGWNWVINCAHTNNRDGYKYGFQIASSNGGNRYAMRSTNVRGEGSWSVLYHTNNKPTPADIGAAPASHNHNYLPLSGGTLTGNLAVSGNGKQATLGTGQNDIYLSNSKSGGYLQLKDNGTLSYSNNVIYHAGNKPTAADVGLPLTTISKTLTVGTSWTNTGIVKSNLQSGSYMVQIYNNGRSDTELWDERWTGVMSWYDGGTNSNEVDEISLHCAGHANNGRHLYLRTVRTPSGGGLRLEIACTHNLGSSTYEFRFRKLI